MSSVRWSHPGPSPPRGLVGRNTGGEAPVHDGADPVDGRELVAEHIVVLQPHVECGLEEVDELDHAGRVHEARIVELSVPIESAVPFSYAECGSKKTFEGLADLSRLRDHGAARFVRGGTPSENGSDPAG